MTTSSQSPIVQRRRLRSELRSERDRAGLTQEQVAAEMDWSLSKVIRIEKGDVGISTNDLRALLSLYDVNDKDRVTSLVGLARSGRQRSWWHAYRDRLSPTFVKLIGYEAEAIRIIAVSGLLIPGLLQTEEYANALAEGSNPVAIDEEEVEFTTKIRMRRQQELFANRQPSPHITAILDEGALRRIVGDPNITLRQLDHLITMAERADVEFGVVPFSAGAYPGMFGTFTILQFEDPVTDDVMYTDQLSGLLLFRDLPDETDQYWEALERIQAVTMSTQDTVALIRKVKEDLSNG
jgi:transcriptional regulator with XRE-family HTH domain